MRIGAELEQLVQLRAKFNEQAGTVETLRADLQTQVDTIVGTAWEGPAADRFRDAWTSQFAPTLQKLQEALAEASQEVENRRQAIEQAGS